MFALSLPVRITCAILAVVAAAALGLGISMAARSGTDIAAGPSVPTAIDVAQASRDYNDQRYLRNVRAELPGLSGVSDAELRTAALFTCAAYGDLSLQPYSWDKVTAAAGGLMRAGFVTTSLLDAQKLAFETSVTC